jgi:chromatin segregation and condensation protein Rec8/ScpA/Scc1 (kleisin family)
LQDNVVKYVSDPPSPPRLVEDAQEDRKGKAKEHRKVGEGDDTVIIEDTSDDEDEETLRERFQLRSRFNRAGMPNIPVIVEKPTSLEASLPVPPRNPRNMARKHTPKKLKITETTSQEVSTLTSVVEYFPRVLCTDC